jgi:hypothetical protein
VVAVAAVDGNTRKRTRQHTWAPGSLQNKICIDFVKFKIIFKFLKIYEDIACPKSAERFACFDQADAEYWCRANLRRICAIHSNRTHSHRVI